MHQIKEMAKEFAFTVAVLLKATGETTYLMAEQDAYSQMEATISALTKIMFSVDTDNSSMLQAITTTDSGMQVNATAKERKHGKTDRNSKANGMMARR